MSRPKLALMALSISTARWRVLITVHSHQDCRRVACNTAMAGVKQVENRSEWLDNIGLEEAAVVEMTIDAI